MDGSVLYETLMRKGVPETYIEKMKQIPNMSEDPYERYYDEIRDDGKKVVTDVPVSKIKGLGFRGTTGLSWFDHACCNGTHNIDVYRCETAFTHLKNETLEEFHEYYKRHPVPLKYYEDDDFYVVYGDGTHRTLWAKVTGSPYIKAHVKHFKKNNSTYEAYQYFKEIEAKFNEYLSFYDLDLKNFSYGSDSTSDIMYKGEHLWFYRIFSSEMFTDKKTLNMETLEQWQHQQEEFKEDYISIFKYRDKFHFLMKIVPIKWQQKFSSFIESWINGIGSTDPQRQEKYDFREIGFRMFCIDRKHVNKTIK